MQRQKPIYGWQGSTPNEFSINKMSHFDYRTSKKDLLNRNTSKKSLNLKRDVRIETDGSIFSNENSRYQLNPEGYSMLMSPSSDKD